MDTIAGPPKGIKKSEPVFLNLEIDQNNQKNSRPLAEACHKVISHAVPGLKTRVAPDSGNDSDDDEFQKLGLPSILFIEESPFDSEKSKNIIHTPADTADKIDFEGFFPQAVRAVIASIANLAVPAKN